MNTPKNRALWSVIYRPAQGREQSASITVRHSLRDTQWFAEGFAEGVAAVIHGNVEYDPEVRPRDLPDDSHHLRVVDAVGDHFAHVFTAGLDGDQVAQIASDLPHLQADLNGGEI